MSGFSCISIARCYSYGMKTMEKEIRSFSKVSLGSGINLYLCPTDQFKTVYLKLFIHTPLDENVTANSLLTSVLLRGCRKYPNMRKIVAYLDSLYGASFGSDVSKIGERHLLEFHFEGVADRFLPEKAHVLENGLAFLKRLLAEPLVKNKGLPADYVAQEKRNLRNEISGLKDNKIAYAHQRCVEEMCHSEPYRIYDEGRIEDIDCLNGEALLKRLQAVIYKYPIDIFIHGTFSPDKIEKSVRRIFSVKRDKTIAEVPATFVNKKVDKENIVREKAEDSEQAKLVMGFRTYTTWSDEDVFPMMIFNGVLGAFPHSKLFLNVREKAGLAYYASSSLERNKGLMFVQAGIGADKFEPAVNIIKEQVNEIKKGNVSDDEMSATIKSIDDRYKTIRDMPFSYIGYTLEQLINQRTDSLETLREKLRSVTKKDVIRMADKIKLDTVYFLAK